MKIGFLITYFYPKMGGAEANCYYLARELAKKHEVHVFCSGEKDTDELIEGIHVHRSKELLRVKYYLAYYPSIISSISRYKLDILHVHGFGFMQHDKVVSSIKKKSLYTKIVCTPHGPFMALKKYNLLGTIFKNLYTPSIIRSLKNYDAIIQVNPFQKKWLTKDYHITSKKIFFVPNGVPASTFKNIPSSYLKKLEKKYSLQGKFILSYVGRIQRYKGLDQIIESLPTILNSHPNSVFIAMGKDADDLKRLEKLAQKLGVSKNVIFTGEVSEQEKLGLLEISDVFIFPSQWEAFGIVMLEAMARGNALISTKTEGGRYLVEPGKNGFLFDYQNNAQLKEEIITLVNRSKLLKKMQQVNRVRAHTFTWEKIALQLEKIYKNLVN